MNTPPPPSEETIEGTLLKIRFENPDNGWSVLELKREDQGPFTAVGSIVGINKGDTIRFQGKWEENPKFGAQFRFNSFLRILPNTIKGIRAFLASGNIPGIGSEMARRIVDCFGLETLKVLDDEPQRVSEVEGIGPKRAQSIGEAWQEQREVRDVMIFLQSHDISPTFCTRIFKTYGSNAVEIVGENPYRLAEDVQGIGFLKADHIASTVGIPKDSLHRATAALLHLLKEASEEGHLFLPQTELTDRALDLLEQPPPVVDRGLTALVEEHRIVQERRKGSTGIFLPKLFRAEKTVAHRIRRLASRKGNPLLGIGGQIVAFEARHGIEFAPQQREAIRGALENSLTVITGGPGTGKTTLIRAIVEILVRDNQSLALAAPTGRAAKRMSEAAGIGAKTIHRLLGFNPRLMQFGRNEDHPLEVDTVIIDEASMMDIPLARHLLLALTGNTRLILVGDVDQLPSVGPGDFLAGVIDSGAASVVRLEVVYRQAARSLIVNNAHRILQGEMIRSGDDDSADFFFIERDHPNQARNTITHLVTERIPRRFGYDPWTEIQVLTPMHRGDLGTTKLNSRLQEKLNPDGQPIGSAHAALRVGDKVMQIRNNYDLEIYNGDLGRIQAFDPKADRVEVSMDARTVHFSKNDLDQLILAYACSIHKSQGSEYPCVILPLHTQHFVMLRRNLFYTAVTRAKQLVVVVGNRRAMALAIGNRERGMRYSRLVERIREGET